MVLLSKPDALRPLRLSHLLPTERGFLAKTTGTVKAASSPENPCCQLLDQLTAGWGRV